MKIFHRECGQDVAYVQLKDLDYVEKKASVLTIPTAVNIKLYKSRRYSYNMSRFVRFTDHEAVKFFHNLEAVIDYDKYKAKEEKELEEEWKVLLEKATSIIEKQKVKTKLDDSYEDTVHKKDSIKELLEVKRGITFLSIPEFVKVM